jgi:HSP20 family protein
VESRPLRFVSQIGYRFPLIIMAKHPFGLLENLLFPPHTASVLGWQPSTDIYRTANGWLIKLDLAGVRPEDVELSLSGNRLTVRGVRRDWCSEEACNCYQMEIAYSHFERHISLPTDLEHARVSAEHRHGMLVVRISLQG